MTNLSVCLAHWLNRYDESRMNGQDEPSHSLCASRRCASRDSHREHDVQDGKNTHDDDDAMRNSGPNTSLVPNSDERATNQANIPNTKDYAMRTMRHSRTNRRSRADKRKRVQ